MIRSIMAVLILAGIALAADPVVKLPETVKGDVGDFIEVKADTEGKIVRWYSSDKSLKLFPTALLKDTRSAVVIGKVPGRYPLLAWTAVGDVPSEPSVCWVVVGGDVPPPPVPPADRPKVFASAFPASINKGDTVTLSWDTLNASTLTLDGQEIALKGERKITPDKTTTYVFAALNPVGLTTQSVTVTVQNVNPVPLTQIWSIWIEDTSQAAAERGSYFANPALADLLKSKGHRWRIVPHNAVGPDGKPPPDMVLYLDDAKGKKLPRLYIVDQDGNPLYTGDAPATPAEMVTLLQKWEIKK